LEQILNFILKVKIHFKIKQSCQYSCW